MADAIDATVEAAEQMFGFTMRDATAADKASSPVRMPTRYAFTKDGLEYRPPPKDGGGPPDNVWIAAPFEIVAETCDDAGNGWGLLLRWRDRTGRTHDWAMPLRLIHGDGNAIAGQLHDAGLACSPSRAAHERLKQFFGLVQVTRRVRCVDRGGWQVTPGGPVFVMPTGETFGGADDDAGVVLQTERAQASHGFEARGTLAEWKAQVAHYAVGNDRLALFCAAAFAGPLLDLLSEPSGGLHLVGLSQSGKTTAARMAGSVWGPGDAGGQLRTWRATANGLEGVAAECSDGALILDELGQADPREVSEVIYMLANEAGKSRAGRGGEARRRRTWRVLFLSTGEISLAAKIGETGKQAKAGQHVRMVDLPADAGAGMGVFQDLHGMPNAAALADHLREATRQFCGTPARAFLAALAAERASDPDVLLAVLRGLRENFIRAYVPANADGQVRSVANRFALIAAAGELATAYSVLPWPEGEAQRAVAACFTAWLSARGGTEAMEDIQAVAQARAFIAAHGASRFEAVGDGVGTDTRVINRAGFKRQDGGSWEYLILPDSWASEVCRGLDAKRAAKVLHDAGFLLGATERHRAALVNVPGYKRLRLYRVSGAILDGGTEEAEGNADGE